MALYCRCRFEKNTRELEELLRRTGEILDSKKNKDYQGVLRKLTKAVEILQAQQKEHLRYRIEYARDMIERVKEGAINVGPLQKPLQTRVRPRAPPPPSRKRSRVE